MRQLGVVLAAVLGTMASGAFATTDIRDEPGGKRLLFVDGNDLRKEPGGDRLMFIDGNTLRDAPGGSVLLVIDGNDLRKEAGGERVGYIDGNDIRDQPGGKRLLFIDGHDIRDEPGGKRLLYIDGDDLTRPQLIAVISVLGTGSSIKIEAPKHEAVADAGPSLAGTYKVTSFKASDDSKMEGEVVFTKSGENYTYTGPGFKGAAFFFDDNLMCADGPERVGLAMLSKQADGSYSGPAINVDGEAATVTAKESGPDEWTLDAVQAKRPDHTEKLVVKKSAWNKPLEGDIDTFKLEVAAKADGAKPDLQGVGFIWHDRLFIAIGVGEGIGTVKLRVDGDNVTGDFVTTGGVTGQVSAQKQ
ncbi:MAG: hypothetical protein QM770_03310 [Tepidisphaeraceae bacterium]